MSALELATSDQIAKSLNLDVIVDELERRWRPTLTKMGPISSVRPLRNHIAVRAAAHLPSDVIALAGEHDEFMRGEVLATGPGKRLPKGRIRPMPVKEGDTVLFRKRSALAYFDPKFSRDVLLITDDDVLGLV